MKKFIYFILLFLIIPSVNAVSTEVDTVSTGISMSDIGIACTIVGFAIILNKK